MSSKAFLIGSLIILSLTARSQGQELKVVITGVKDDQGTIWVALHKPAEDFMKERFMSIKIVPQKGSVSAVFKDVPEGTYVVSVLHDANNNKVVDKNAIGIPLEGVGFSNNVMGRFGPPEFKKASFEFPKSSEVSIALKYW